MNAVVDISNTVLETKRLLLRAWQSSDINDFYEYASVDGVGQRAGWKPHESMEESQRILDLFIKEKKTFAIVLKENSKVIGSLGLENISEIPDKAFEHQMGREIGYVLSKKYWGNGYMPEAVKRTISYCFEDLNYDFLTCAHFITNPQSQRVIEKCGFIYRKEIEYQTRIGTMEQSKLYVLINEK